RRAFNMGIGLVAVVDRTAADEAVRMLTELGEKTWLVGEVAAGGAGAPAGGGVVSRRMKKPHKLGGLGSGTGTNPEAILTAVAEQRLASKVAVVISNKAGVLALERAEKAGVPTRVIPHGNYGSREEFDRALVQALREAGVDWVVLAGFMRLITRTML